MAIGTTAAIIGAGALGAGASILSGNKAASAQKSAAKSAAAVQMNMFNQTREDLAPYRDHGKNYLSALNFENGLGPRPKNYRGFEATPGYNFRLGEGFKAIERSAAARGGLNSGATMKALGRYGQDYGSAEYGNYLARIGAGVGMGQSAANQTGAFGANAARGVADAKMAGGEAEAAGYLGIGNAFNNTLQNTFRDGARYGGWFN